MEEKPIVHGTADNIERAGYIHTPEKIARLIHDVLLLFPDADYLVGDLTGAGTGHLLAPFADEHLAPAIRAAGRGEVFFYPRDARLILQGLGRIEASKLWESLGGERLDKRDVEVLQMTAAGLRSTDIAPVLDITPRAVERAQLRVVEKLGLKQRDMLVRYLQSHGSAEP